MSSFFDTWIDSLDDASDADRDLARALLIGCRADAEAALKHGAEVAAVEKLHLAFYRQALVRRDDAFIGYLIDIKMPVGPTSLSTAAEWGRTGAVVRMLDVFLARDDKIAIKSAIRVAVTVGRCEIFLKLDAGLRSMNGHDAWRYDRFLSVMTEIAAANGRTAMIEALQSCGADVLANGHMAFLNAIENDKVAVVRCFLDNYEVDVHIGDDAPLRAAIKTENTELCRMLLEADLVRKNWRSDLLARVPGNLTDDLFEKMEIVKARKALMCDIGGKTTHVSLTFDHIAATLRADPTGRKLFGFHTPNVVYLGGDGDGLMRGASINTDGTIIELPAGMARHHQFEAVAEVLFTHYSRMAAINGQGQGESAVRTARVLKVWNTVRRLMAGHWGEVFPEGPKPEVPPTMGP